jgi:Cu(I)/Ag(I) efflux system protein CusF
MKICKYLYMPVIVSALAMSSLPAMSQVNEMTQGVVRKIDKENSKITIRHEEIKSLDMPPMTMVFQVRNAALLDKVQVGQTVKFTVVQDGGKLVVIDVQGAP